MIKYLLDTNTIVDIIRDKESMPSKRLMAVGLYRCAIADMTVFELLYGAFNSEQREANLQMISNLSKAICTLPSSPAYMEAARQKCRLRKLGLLIEDIDLLIGCTAIANGLTLISDNTKHMSRLENIRIESWSSDTVE